jgi:hypothetical protein
MATLGVLLLRLTPHDQERAQSPPLLVGITAPTRAMATMEGEAVTQMPTMTCGQ